ncbi:MAG: DNA-3-methyladenine glycosylase 2 family protein [Thaumarchaeota archaeon]|nr:DNA-3-methyladenine glycosylase 2 family protein [Nitrososphaerota archaeon]
METFRYGAPEMEYLKTRDKNLGTAIKRIGRIEREVIPDLFSALVNCVVSQQVSAKAAGTVWSRMQECFGEMTPQSISAATLEDIQRCGMSMRKATYIRGIGNWASEGAKNLEELWQLPDDEVIRRLSSLDGVGVWTAEMILIFTMGRPDVVSWGDLAIRRGMMNLYGLEELTRVEFNEYRKRYSPYGSVASLYLWELSH